MSRSRKHMPCCAQRGPRFMKKIANRKVRRTMKNPDAVYNHKDYKKIFCSYNIYDYKSIEPYGFEGYFRHKKRTFSKEKAWKEYLKWFLRK